MTTIDSEVRLADQAGDDVPRDRRAVLDLSIDEELVRGDRRGLDLGTKPRKILTAVVERELQGGAPLTEAEVLSATRTGRILGAARQRARIDALATIGLLRREGDEVHATVAGIAAIVRPSRLDRPHPPRALLRTLRRAELRPA